MYIHLYIHGYIYTHIHVHTFTHRYKDLSVYIYPYIPDLNIDQYTYLSIYLSVWLATYMYTSMYAVILSMCGGGASGDRGIHLRRPRPDRERLITPAIARVCAAGQRVAAGEPARHRPDHPMCTQCARVRRGVQCRELQRSHEEVLDRELLQLVVAQVTVQRAGAARDRRRRRAKGSVGRTGLAAPRGRGFRL